MPVILQTLVVIRLNMFETTAKFLLTTPKDMSLKGIIELIFAAPES